MTSTTIRVVIGGLKALQQHSTRDEEVIQEPKISLPVKFNGTMSQFRGFLNQVQLIIQMDPTRYPPNVSRGGLVGIAPYLTGTTLSWFAPLLEKKSPLLNDFEEFIKEFTICFVDRNSVRSTINNVCCL